MAAQSAASQQSALFACNILVPAVQEPYQVPPILDFKERTPSYTKSRNLNCSKLGHTVTVASYLSQHQYANRHY